MGKRALLGATAMLLVIAAAYASFFVAPTERTMGLIQRIFYFHVGCAWAGMDAFVVCFVCNLLYVWKRGAKYDWLAVSAVEVGLVLTTVVLISGPIWAHPVWGIWWTWDARLTSTFVLWLLYVSYLLLRTLIDEPDRRALLSALFGIFAFLDVPLVFGAIRWWRTQHPSPVILGGPGSGLDPTMEKVLFFSVFAMHVLAAFLIVERYLLEKMKSEVDVLQREAEAL
ncbi:MAG TPA: cytochrome c biogenesis protein CcsA [Candidatus Eremiobacteraceae bacterium]|nr:cytochrome c biogenesis protein CcsA [Candidatus Eremiobacteraceae bacterium]